MATPSAPEWQRSGPMVIHLVNGPNGSRACGRRNAGPATNQVVSVTCPECNEWYRLQGIKEAAEAKGMEPEPPLTQHEIMRFLEGLDPKDERMVMMILLDRRFARSEKREVALAKELADLKEQFDDFRRSVREAAGC